MKTTTIKNESSIRLAVGFHPGSSTYLQPGDSVMINGAGPYRVHEVREGDMILVGPASFWDKVKYFCARVVSRAKLLYWRLRG